MTTRLVAQVSGSLELGWAVRRAGLGVKGLSQGSGWGMLGVSCLLGIECKCQTGRGSQDSKRSGLAIETWTSLAIDGVLKPPDRLRSPRE